MKSSKALSWLRHLLPYAMAVGILAYLFYKIPIHRIGDSLHGVHWLGLILFSLIYFSAIAWLDVRSLHWVLNRFCGFLAKQTLWPGRAISYLLSIMNYNAGQLALAAYLKNQRGFSLFRTMGAVFFVTATDLYWIIILAFGGSFFFEFQIEGHLLSNWVQRVGYIAFAALFFHLAFWHRWFSRFIPTKIHFSFVDWIRGRHLFQAFHHAQLRDYARTALDRFPMHLIFIGSLWVVLRLFGVECSIWNILATVPVIYLLGALPITPGGLGAVQLATVELLKDKISSPTIAPGSLEAQQLLLAMSLIWMGLNYFWKAIIGLYYFRKEPLALLTSDTSSNATHHVLDSTNA